MHVRKSTVDSKIIRALEIIRVKKNSYVIQFYEINNCQVMIFWLYTVYNKYEMLKFGNQTIEKNASITASARIILLSTVVSSKIIPALAIILGIFL